MNGSDVKRAAYLSRLFEQMMAQVDPSLSFENRVKQAKCLMDKSLGQGWRSEVERGMTGRHMGPPPLDIESFYDRVTRMGKRLGIGMEPPESPRPGERHADHQLIFIVMRMDD